MGIEDKQIETIIEAHSETVTALKAERDKAKETAAKVPDLQRQLEEAKKATEGGSDWQASSTRSTRPSRTTRLRSRLRRRRLTRQARTASRFLRRLASRRSTWTT